MSWALKDKLSELESCIRNVVITTNMGMKLGRADKKRLARALVLIQEIKNYVMD